jgi:hypothetical protein
MTRFRNNLHQVRAKSQNLSKPNYLKILWEARKVKLIANNYHLFLFAFLYIHSNKQWGNFSEVFIRN